MRIWERLRYEYHWTVTPHVWAYYIGQYWCYLVCFLFGHKWELLHDDSKCWTPPGVIPSKTYLCHRCFDSKHEPVNENSISEILEVL
jgi:hypothetical protein